MLSGPSCPARVSFGCPLLTESPFAPLRCYLSRGCICCSLDQHYPALFATTDSCATPDSSSALSSSPETKIFAGCCKPLLVSAPSRRYLRESFSACKDPYPGCPYNAFTRFFPQDYGLPNVLIRSALGKTPHNAISVWRIFSRLQSFANVLARRFARPSDCSYHRLFRL